MSLTAENYAANLKTAARNAAAVAGVTGKPPAEWTLAQRQTYNNEMVRQILAYPGSFDPATVAIAATVNTDYGLRGHYFDTALGTAVTAASDTIRTVNPLDAQNLPTVAKWITAAVVLLAAWWLFLRRPSHA
jgi:hypothetical protein